MCREGDELKAAAILLETETRCLRVLIHTQVSKDCKHSAATPILPSCYDRFPPNASVIFDFSSRISLSQAKWVATTTFAGRPDSLHRLPALRVLRTAHTGKSQRITTCGNARSSYTNSILDVITISSNTLSPSTCTIRNPAQESKSAPSLMENIHTLSSVVVLLLDLLNLAPIQPQNSVPPRLTRR